MRALSAHNPQAPRNLRVKAAAQTADTPTAETTSRRKQPSQPHRRTKRPLLHPPFPRTRAEGEAALEEVPKEVTSARAGGLALGTLSRVLTTLDLLYTGGPGARPAVGDYRLALQRGVPQRGGGGGGNRWGTVGGWLRF